MEKIYFADVVNTGNLYLEKVFNKFEDENILFICKNEEGSRFLCLCYEFRSSLRWVVCKIEPEMLVKILIKKADIRSAFLCEKDNIIHIEYKNDMEKSEIISLCDENSNIIPAEGIFLKEDYNLSKYLIYISLHFTYTTSFKCERFFNYTHINGNLENYNFKECMNAHSHMVIPYDLKGILQNTDKELCFVDIDMAA